MKRLTTMILAVIACTFMLGCQPTPDSPVVIQKDLEQMIEKAADENN